MKHGKYGCGIDMAKEKFDACLGLFDINQGFTKVSVKQFPNTSKGYLEYLEWIKKQCKYSLPVFHLMEATGIYYENLAFYLYKKKESVSVILPNKAKKYKESLGFKTKTDGVDALALSRMVCEQVLTLWQAAHPNLYKLCLFTRQLENVVVQTGSVNNQLEALSFSMYPNKHLEKLLKQQIIFFDKQREELLETIIKITEEDEELKRKFANILKIKGLGLQAIATIIAETNGFELVENISQLVSYVGYDVVENQSGNHVGKTKISKKGNSRIRRCLHFPALNVVRFKVKPFVQLYERVYKTSNIKMKGYTAVQKKLLVMIYTLWKKDEVFNENHYQDKISRDDEKEPSFVSASKKQHKISNDNDKKNSFISDLQKKQKKVAPVKTEATQDKHPSKNRSMPSFV